jgi:serine/threonine-protein kinase
MRKFLRLTLGTRIFLITATLVALAVAAAVGVTSIVGERIARRAVVQALDRSASVQTSFQVQRQGQLRLIARLLSTDPNLRAYLAEAIDGGDLRSVLDLLEDRRADLGSDFVILVDPEGTVLANTDRPDDVGESMEEDPLFEVAYERFEASGVWEREGRLYNAVAVPLRQGALLSGFMIAGFGIDDLVAREIRRVSDTDVAILAGTSSAPRVVATTLGGAEQSGLVSALQGGGTAVIQVLEKGETVEQLELALGNRRSIAQLRPLLDPTGAPIAATVSIASLDEAIAPYRQISMTLLGVGAVAVLLASLLSWLVSRRVMQPVRELADAATAASKGDYDRRFKTKSGDEVGQLASALDSLLSDLREKRDMESYVADLQRTIPEGGGAAALEQAETCRVAVLGLELKNYSSSATTKDPSATVERLGQDLRRIGNLVKRQKGRVEAVYGHRVLAVFEGEAAAYRAFTAAADLLAALAARHSAFDEQEPPAAAVVVGDAVHGTVLVGDAAYHALVGLAVQQLEGLLREASPGDIVLSTQVFQELASAFERAGLQLAPQRGILSPQSLYLVSGDIAAQMSGGAQAVTTALGAEPQRITAAGGGIATMSEIAPGSLLGERFEILSTLGAGGMGVVYKVRDRELDDLVALKMLRSDVWGDRDQLERLKSELKLARKITHPNVLRTYDFGEIDGIPFITMEYVRGITLRYLLDENQRLPYSAGLRIARQLCRGLEAAHGQGVIHRDIKPENTIIEPSGNAKLMDFGIARPVKRMTPGQTTPGTVIGTPHYLSPEQLEGREPDERADIYAVGVVLYELFAGKLPFTGDTPMQIVIKHLQEAPVPPSNLWPEIPQALEKVVLKCLEKNPDKRYRKIEQVLEQLDAMRA